MSGSVFPSSVRLRKRQEFLRLSRNARTYSVQGFLVVWGSNDRQTARIGLTVSRKVGGAVVRNRIKRYIREIFRRFRCFLPQVDINVIARRESADMDYQAVVREMERAFRHIGPAPCSSAVHSS